MPTLLPNAEQSFADVNGVPLAAGTVTFYIPNTSTLKDTYGDPDGNVVNTNPVVLDAAGRAIIYGTGQYRQVVKDQFGNLIWDQLTTDTGDTGITSIGGATGDISLTGGGLQVVLDVLGLIGYAVVNVQLITATGNYVAGANVRALLVLCIGAGGGGGGANNVNYGDAGGGGGGGASLAFITVGILASEPVTVGVGGTGGANSGGNGAAGGASAFGTHCSATAGAGGIGDVGGSTFIVNDGGAGGQGAGGVMNMAGGPGCPGIRAAASNNGLAGNGGNSPFGGGGLGSSAVGGGIGAAGGRYGGGGGGSTGASGTPFAGGVGANGAVLVIGLG